MSIARGAAAIRPEAKSSESPGDERHEDADEQRGAGKDEAPDDQVEQRSPRRACGEQTSRQLPAECGGVKHCVSPAQLVEERTVELKRSDRLRVPAASMLVSLERQGVQAVAVVALVLHEVVDLVETVEGELLVGGRVVTRDEARDRLAAREVAEVTGVVVREDATPSSAPSDCPGCRRSARCRRAAGGSCASRPRRGQPGRSRSRRGDSSGSQNARSPGTLSRSTRSTVLERLVDPAVLREVARVVRERQLAPHQLGDEGARLGAAVLVGWSRTG